MYAGEIVNNIIVNSNDLVNPAAVVSFKANVVGDLHPVLSAETTVDFGDVFRTSKAVMALNVANAGRAEMAVTAVTVDGEKFSIDAAPFKVPPASRKTSLSRSTLRPKAHSPAQFQLNPTAETPLLTLWPQ